ncbi:MAG: DUF192 domain-containing protein [Thermoleophilia bacterium]|nr:DUF192 domain-containing protein [Thermoleophilia bacterium]
MVELRDYDSGLVLVPSVTTVAAFSLGAMRGLIGSTSIDPEWGLLLRDPLGCIHTFGMRCSIDIVFLSRELQVREVSPHVPPRRLRWSPGGVVQLELAAGQAAARSLVVGRRLTLVERGIEPARGRCNQQSPQTKADSGDPSHLYPRAACAGARDLPTVRSGLSERHHATPEALPSVASGTTQRNRDYVCKLAGG